MRQSEYGPSRALLHALGVCGADLFPCGSCCGVTWESPRMLANPLQTLGELRSRKHICFLRGAFSTMLQIPCPTLSLLQENPWKKTNRNLTLILFYLVLLEMRSVLSVFESIDKI